MEWYEFVAFVLGLFILVPAWLYMCTFMITSAFNQARMKKAGEMLKIMKAMQEAKR